MRMDAEVNANEHRPKHQHRLLELTVLLGWNETACNEAEALLIENVRNDFCEIRNHSHRLLYVFARTYVRNR